MWLCLFCLVFVAENGLEYNSLFSQHIIDKFEQELANYNNSDNFSPLLNCIISYIEDNDTLFNELADIFTFYPLSMLDDNK